MSNKIIIPSAGQITDEFKILEIKVKVGDIVKEGDILAEIETDKSTMELESFCDGKVMKILSKNGDTVSTGETIIVIK